MAHLRVTFQSITVCNTKNSKRERQKNCTSEDGQKLLGTFGNLVSFGKPRYPSRRFAWKHGENRASIGAQTASRGPPLLSATTERDAATERGILISGAERTRRRYNPTCVETRYSVGGVRRAQINSLYGVRLIKYYHSSLI